MFHSFNTVRRLKMKLKNSPLCLYCDRVKPDFSGISVADTFIPSSSHVHNLGVTFDKSFTWKMEVK